MDYPRSLLRRQSQDQKPRTLGSQSEVISTPLHSLDFVSNFLKQKKEKTPAALIFWSVKREHWQGAVSHSHQGPFTDERCRAALKAGWGAAASGNQFSDPAFKLKSQGRAQADTISWCLNWVLSVQLGKGKGSTYE